MKDTYEKGEAFFSGDRRYRYALSRCWDAAKPKVMFIGLNPSTADAAVLDPTLRRVVGFAVREGFGGFWMANLFAFRATNPAVMVRATDPVGRENDDWLLKMAGKTDRIVACWGTFGLYLDRDRIVCNQVMADFDMCCLGVTKDKHPKHPLYLARKTELEPFTCR